jgi:spore maturation protein B
MLEVVGVVSRWAIPVFLTVVLVAGAIRGVRVFEAFVEGAEQGFSMAVRLIPFLMAMIVAISIFRASGAMDILLGLIAPFFTFLGAPPEILPHALMRPLSGGAALGIATELVEEHEPDSFIGLLISTAQGSSDTTFYVLTLYFGAVGIRKYRYAVATGLTADLTTLLASIFIVAAIFKG